LVILVQLQVHFGHFTNWYSAHLYYFDIHPPLGKLTFWAVAAIFGYDYNNCEFEEINKDYGPECQYYIMRATASAFSVLTVVLIYLCARNFGASVYGGLIAAALLIFDNLNLTESRLVLIDSQLVFWCVACLWVAQCWWKRLNEHYDAEAILESHGPSAICANIPDTADTVNSRRAAPRLMSEWVRLAWCIAVGATCANAFSVKMTGAATPAAIAIESFFGLWFLRRATRFRDLVTVLIAGFFTYSLWFACHFGLQWNSGPNRVEEEFMTPLVRNHTQTASVITLYDKQYWDNCTSCCFVVCSINPR
jgi:dolichyl-phosphate-mannose--protein O-mannosyl transferase